MRIRKLDVEGFGPFRDRQILDFEAAASGGLLLISGRTGAGKSSLLDAVSFALYGQVPRYDGQVSRVRSDHSGPELPTLVRLEFEVAGDRYLVERSPEYTRPAKRGGGTTTQKTEARLWRWGEAAGDWEGLASRPVDVAAELTPVLRLNHQQFLQVVMLSQGGFQRFLRAADDERQATLRTLFQTGRFAEIEAALAERRKRLDGAARESEARIEGLLGGLEEALERDNAVRAEGERDAAEQATTVPNPAAGAGQAGERTLSVRRDAAVAAVTGLETRAQELHETLEQRREAQRESAAALERARTLAQAQERLFRAEERRDALATLRPEIDEQRVSLDQSDRAAHVVREARALEAARAEATTASEAWESRWCAARSALGDDPSLSSADSWSVLEPALTAARDRSARQLGSLAEAQADELRLEKLRAEQEARQAKLTSVAAEGAAELAALAALPEQLAAVRAAREHAAIEAATLEQRRTDAEQARGRREAATEAGRLERELASAQAHAAELATTAAAAASEVSDLLARRIAGMAGELADALQPGEPCTVCGSATHPNPATHADPVTPDAIAEAETAQRAAQQRLDSAREAERGIESALAAARVAAAGLEPEAAADALDDATAQYEQAKAAATQLTTLSEQLAALDAETATRTARVGELSAQEAALSANIDSATTQAASLEAELLAARAGSDSIRARLDALEAEHAALEAALRAGNALGSATRAVEAAKTLVAAELVAQGFAEPDSSADALTLAESAATSAHLDATAQATLRAAVRKFDEDTQRNAGELAAPDLHGIERTPVDLEPAATASAAATAQADAALSAHAAAARIASEHRATLDRVERELAGSAATGEALLRLRRLADTMQGKDPNTKRMRLEVFVLAARLEAIVEAANRRLSTMVGGRYRLAHDDGLRARGRQSGLGLAVIDEYTGRERSTDSLSGGESFLASLALALGLADVVTAESGGLELDTLFIDEGFGSLDPDALDQALATLDGLREGGRTVALISHVTELKERLAGGLEVVADGQGISSIRGDGVLSPDDPSHTSDAATTD